MFPNYLILGFAGSSVQAFGVEITRSPTYEKMDPEARLRKQLLDKTGYDVFKKYLQQTVLFRGTHRFKAGDPLAAILENMRREGHNPLTPDLKQEIRKCVYRPELGDKRLSSDYCQMDEAGQQIGPKGFFANGVFSAINWDQVARLQQITVWESAKQSSGVFALCNTACGHAVRIHRGFPPAVGRVFQARYGSVLSLHMADFLHAPGQLLYYVQAVDLVHQQEFFRDQEILEEALKVTNMASKTANLMSFLPLHIGLQCKLTKKVMAPELVQECPCELLRINFHPEERFGIPGCPAGLSQPPANHPCWKQGYLLLDYMPQSLTLRVEDSAEDISASACVWLRLRRRFPSLRFWVCRLSLCLYSA